MEESQNQFLEKALSYCIENFSTKEATKRIMEYIKNDRELTEQLRQYNVKDTIKTLRTFFRVTNAVFEFQNSIQLAVSGYISPSKMYQLHKIALNEIEKENPDLLLIDNLLAEMEITAAKNSKNNE